MVINPEEKKEKPRPAILYRGVTMHPEKLSLGMLDLPLVQGDSKHNDDPARNEDGVYMSTNPLMVRASYAQGSCGDEDLYLEIPPYMRRGSVERMIVLPSVGIVYEIDTEGLDIRPPEITPELTLVYNNDFEGDEWIADEIPPQNYKIVKLILTHTHNDPNRLEIEVNGSDRSALAEAMDEVRSRFREIKAEAELFVEFLGTLSSNERMSERLVQNRWEAFQREHR